MPLAVDSLVLLVCGVSLIPPMREKECLAKCFHWKICDFVSGKLSKCLYLHSYTHLITSSALNEWFLVRKFKKRGLLHRVSITDNEYEANMIDNKCHKIYLSGPFGFSVLRHPNHLVLHYLPIPSLRSRRLEVVGERENGPAQGRHAPVFSCFHYFQAPATQANRFLASAGAPNDGMFPRTPGVS